MKKIDALFISVSSLELMNFLLEFVVNVNCGLGSYFFHYTWQGGWKKSFTFVHDIYHKFLFTIKIWRGVREIGTHIL